MPVAPVVRGELTASQRAELDRAIRAAEQATRVEFSVFRGLSEGDPRAFAELLHASLAAPDRSVLVMVDPVAHVIEVVTGADVRRSLSDDKARLAVLAMQSAFAEGDDLDGLVRGVTLLADYAGAPQLEHTHS